jgi:hypothetical protein
MRTDAGDLPGRDFVGAVTPINMMHSFPILDAPTPPWVLIVVAVIGATGAIGGAVAAALIPKYRKSQKNLTATLTASQQTTAAAEQAVQSFATSAAARIPYSTDQLELHARVVNEAGDGVAVRHFRGIKVRDGHVLRQWKTALRTSGAFDPNNPPKVTTSNVGKGIVAKPKLVNQQLFEVVLNFVGGLTEADPPLDVEIRADVAGAHLLRASEIARAYAPDPFKYEYIAEAVDTDLQRLDLSIEFPAGLKPPVYRMVFYFASEVVAEDRLKGMPPVDESQPNRAAISIASPQPAFKYALYWIGLPEESAVVDDRSGKRLD